MNPTQYWPWPPMLKRPQRNANATASAAENQRRRGPERLLEVAPRRSRVLSRQPLIRPVEARSFEDRPVGRDRVVAGDRGRRGRRSGRRGPWPRAGRGSPRRARRGSLGAEIALLDLRRRRRRRDAHAAVSRRPPVIAMPSSSSVTSGPYSPTIRPSKMTRMRSDERQDLLELERDEQDGAALVALLDEPAVDELDRADVEPARRLAGDEHPRVALDLACDDDLLLVAAREGRGERRAGSRRARRTPSAAGARARSGGSVAASRTASSARSGSRGGRRSRRA